MIRRKGFTQRRIVDTEATLRRIEADVAALLRDTLNPCARVGEQQIAVKVINLLRRLRWRVTETYTPLLEPEPLPQSESSGFCGDCPECRQLMAALRELDANQLPRC